MQLHRFLGQLAEEPRVQDPTPVAAGFMIWPVALMPVQACPPWQEVYRLLFEKPQQPARPAWLKRLQADLRN
jgi:hypothetical protein